MTILEGEIYSAVQIHAQGDNRIHGMSLAQVIDNNDSTGEGRVQLHLPWMEGFEPWARLVVPMAGNQSGMYFIPQVGEEVLVAFGLGDRNDPFVIGSLWNGVDKPPAQGPLDPVNKRIIKTPAGHKLEFDDAEQTITIEHIAGAKLELSAEKIEISIGAATIKLEQSGTITINGSTSLSLEAASIDVSADGSLSLSSSAIATLKGGSLCKIDAASIMIG